MSIRLDSSHFIQIYYNPKHVTSKLRKEKTINFPKYSQTPNLVCILNLNPASPNKNT